ncbi:MULTISPECIES: DMT family transporter [unclassified Caballeronia]|uniref:DMT family transporter n=1 Tax=unclassified Caballeronia TaxID=2646786 RepID=UPI0028623C12|nr:MULTISPECIES: DMT family transporter [unclassified Caballeronia]MDR5738700.1 DMT family transporter [Caballeronia sp. LZ016]MDR5811431.1 DMT family transporter [Caballeronia sp. LZ019]
MNRYALYLIASMLLVGSNVGIGKSIVASVPVPLFALLRFVIALAVLWPLFRLSKMKQVGRAEWINLFLQALFGTFGFTLLMLNGVALTSAVAAGVITSTMPAVVALFAWIFLKERPGGRAFVSIALAVVGVVIVNVAQSGGAHAGADTSAAAAGSLAGNLMVVGAVCCESLYVILSRRLTQTLPAIDICAYTHGFGFLLMLPLGLPSALAFDWSGVDWITWALVGWYALSASVFSFWLWMKGIRHVPGSLAGVFSAVLPVAAALYGIAFLGERPTLAHGAALACVMAGIVLASLRRRPRSSRESHEGGV